MFLVALIIGAEVWANYRKMEGRVKLMNEPLWTGYDSLLVAAVVFGALTLVLSPWLRDTSMFYLLFPGAMFILITSCALIVGRFMNRRALALRAQSPSGEPRLGKTSGPRDGQRKANP